MLKIAFSHASKIKGQTMEQQRRRKSSVAHYLKIASELKATKRIALLVGSYIVCWGPSTTYYLLVWICPDRCFPRDFEPAETWVRFFFKLMVMFHAFLTPIIFCWNSTIFRTQARQVTSRRFSRSEMSSYFNRTSAKTKEKYQTNTGATVIENHSLDDYKDNNLEECKDSGNNNSISPT